MTAIESLENEVAHNIYIKEVTHEIASNLRIAFKVMELSIERKVSIILFYSGFKEREMELLEKIGLITRDRPYDRECSLTKRAYEVYQQLETEEYYNKKE